jgi:hypothetical protein
VTGENRRRFRRIILRRPVLLAADGRSWPGELLDISLRGALMSTGQTPLPAVGTQGVADIALSDDPDFLIRMQVEVCRTDAQRIGLRVTGIDIEDACQLRRLVELNAGDAKLLQRELEELSAN